MSDEDLIRQFQKDWMEATVSSDVVRVSQLMTDDVEFLVAGKSPFGKEAFLDSFRMMAQRVQLQCTGEFEQIDVCGNLAVAKGKLSVSVTPISGTESKRLAGYTLSILKRSADGQWRLWRDANLLSPEVS